MHITRISGRIALVTAFVVCIGVGFMLALVLRERFGGTTAQEDPCYGQGQLVNSWKQEVTQEEVDSLKASRPDLADMEAGMVEYRQCRWGPGYEVIIDEKGHVFSFRQPTNAELESYYKEHPDENPQNQIATAQANSIERSFVPADLPVDQTQGCEPTWIRTELHSVGVAICHPSDWQVRDEKTYVIVGNGAAEVGVPAAGTEGQNAECPNAEVVDAPGGSAHVCGKPQNPYGHGYIIRLPNGRVVSVTIYNEASAEDQAAALRAAFNAEVLP